ncbi:MAG: glycoside hydrolase family 15 protein [Steroidobacteraceae bacterium]
MSGHYRPAPLEDYGLIGDCHSAALVSREGSIDWLCWPRFDSSACFAALLGDERNGHWQIAPAGPGWRSSQRYDGETLVLETLFECVQGEFALLDFMPRDQDCSLVRIVEGRRGQIPVDMCLRLRFDYGSTIPWVTRPPGQDGIVGIAGPNLAVLRTTAPLRGEGMSTVSQFTVAAGERVAFVLRYGASHLAPPPPLAAEAALAQTLEIWRAWSARCDYQGHRREAVMRSLLTLKALTYAPTGGIVAAPTTSLPERLGGRRNWDYRYCWLRDATLTLIAFMGAGYFEEARAWRDWLLRAVAGSPDDLQIMYGIAGERRLAEHEIPWLAGYQGAAPVRVGNAASLQLQLDVWGELMDALHLTRQGGLASEPSGWALQRAALTHLEKIWQEPDDGIWEMRGGRRQFTHSKVMAWVAFDRSIRDAEQYGLDAPLQRWREVRDHIHRLVCEQGFDVRRGTFTQYFGGRELDASLLLIPIVGFLPINDPRVTGTIAAIERDLLIDGLVQRYRTESGVDGLPAGEGVFIACSCWLADVWQMQQRPHEADALLDRVLALRNPLGLLSEEYDRQARRQVGNFPQGFSHLAVVRTALGLHHHAPLRERIEGHAMRAATDSVSR